MNEITTEDLRERIKDAEQRNAERAGDLPEVVDDAVEDVSEESFADQAGRVLSDTANKVTTFAKEHPGLAIAGGVVAGLAIASLFKGPRQLAAKGGAKAAGLATVGGEMALAYALSAYEKAQEAGRIGANKLDDLGDSAGDKARRLRRDAEYHAANAADGARIAARDTGKAISRKLGRD